MRIGIIIFRFNVKGGTQRVVLSFIKELIRLGHEVTLYTFLYSKENSFQDFPSSVKIVSLSDVHPGWEKKRPKMIWIFTRPHYLREWLNWRSAARELSFLIARDTEILNPHGSVSYMVSYYFKKNVKNVPSVWMIHTMASKLWTFWQKNQADPSYKVSFVKRLFHRILEQIEIMTFIKAQNVITVLDFKDQEYVKQYYGRDSLVVRNGIDIGRFSYKEKASLQNKKSIVIFLSGIFFIHRRFEDAFGAAKILTDRGYDLSVNLIGDYNHNLSYYEKLVILARELNIEHKIKFWGVVSDEDLIRLHRVSDIAVFPYHLQSWGLAVFEAMACGTPVVVSRTLGASEVLTDGENAFLVNPKSPSEIAEAIERLIKNSELYLKLSRNGREFVEKNITWERYTQEMLKIFEKALGDRRNR